MALLRRLTEQRAISPNTLFRTGADLDGYSPSLAGVRVTTDTALGYSGIWACVRLLTSDISTLPVGTFRKDGESRIPITSPAWLDTPDPYDPSITRIDHFAQVVISLLLDGNAFVLCTPDTVRPERLEVLNPRQVEVTKADGIPIYRLRDRYGRLTDQELTPLDILHVKINAKPSGLRGMSPIDANQGSIGVSLAAQKWVENWFGRGSQAPGFIEVPVGSNDSVAGMRADMAKHHGGYSKSGILGFLTGGATYKPTGVSPRDADIRNIFNHQLEEGARIYGIPPFLVGSQEPAGVAYGSAVERAQHYVEHCLMHYVRPIEVAYTRLIPGDRRLRDAGSDTYMRFNVDALLRGNPIERVAYYKGMFDVGGLSPDEIRALEERAPLPDGKGEDHYYPSANYTPIGQVPTNAPGTAVPAA